MAKKEFLKTPLVQKGEFIKAPGQDSGVERAARIVQGDCLYTVELGEEKSRGSSLKGFLSPKENLQITGGLTIVKLKLFFPLAKHYH